MSNTITLRIETIDGETHDFGIPILSEDGPDYSIGSKLKRFLSEQKISLLVDDELLLIPMHRVKQIRLFPIQSKLPKGVLATAMRLDSTSVVAEERSGPAAA